VVLVVSVGVVLVPVEVVLVVSVGVVLVPVEVVLVVSVGVVLVPVEVVLVVSVGVVATGHWSIPGSGFSFGEFATITSEPRWPSTNVSPTATEFLPVEAMMAALSTQIGFCPVCSRSLSPGFPTYLHT
jgi:hypothetical protein